MWVTSSPLSAEEATAALAAAVPDLKKRIAEGQIEILDSSEWYTKRGKFNSKKILAGWEEKLQMASERGFAGLRLCGFTTWLESGDWDAFIEYEDEVGNLVERSNVIALCAYSLTKCDSHRVIDVVCKHQHAIVKRESKWTLVENTERAKAVLEAKRLEEKYQRTADNIGVAIYSALPDESSTTILVTDRIMDITGHGASEFLEDPTLFSKIVHPDDSAGVWEKIRKHRLGRTPLDAEYRIVRKDGTVRWVKDMAYPYLNGQGEIERIDGFMEDVTERRRTEEALRDSEERLALAQKAARIGSWDWDIRTGALTWSDEIEPMFGFEPGQFGRTYEAFLRSVHAEDRPMVEAAVKKCIESESDYEIEHRIVLPDGSIRWISEKGNVIRDDDQKAIRMLGIAQDVTRSKQVEQRIRELNEDLERKTAELTAVNRELEAFCYSVSHDLRAPLRRIEGFGHLLLEDAKDKLNAEEKDYLRRITAATSNMDQLINDLLKLSRVSMLELSLEKLDLTELANEVADQLQKAAPERSVTFVANGPLRVVGDKALLKIALTNLLENAWKFTGNTEQPQVEFGARKSGRKTVYFVRDNGAGFNSSMSERLFMPFQRLHSASEFPGSGIGLAIVSRIIERHGGRIWAEAAIGKGATFYFTIASLSMRRP